MSSLILPRRSSRSAGVGGSLLKGVSRVGTALLLLLVPEMALLAFEGELTAKWGRKQKSILDWLKSFGAHLVAAFPYAHPSDSSPL